MGAKKQLEAGALPPSGERHPLADKAAAGGRMRGVGLEGIAATRTGRGHADRIIRKLLRAAKFLHSRERRLVAETVYASVRHRRTWEELLGVPPGGDDLALWLASLVRFAGLDPKLAAEIAPAWDFSRVAHLEQSFADWCAGERSPEQRLGVAASLPDWFARRLLADFGAERAVALAAACNGQAPTALRANRLHGDREGLAEALKALDIATSPCRWARDGLVLEQRANLVGSAPFKEGRFEIQDEGSQLLCELVAPPPRSRLIDVCAGAGGKTLALAAALANKGRIFALDVRASALQELRRRCRRAGASNVQALEIAEQGPWPKALAPAERVLVDAPCSGSGVLRRHPESRWRWGEEDIGEFAARQRAILERALPLVKPGGRLIYATCSLFREENEQVLEGFRAAHPELVPMPAKEILSAARARELGDGEVLRLLPDSHGCDGFFGAVLRLPA